MISPRQMVINIFTKNILLNLLALSVKMLQIRQEQGAHVQCQKANALHL